MSANNAKLVEKLVKERHLKTPLIIQAFKKVDRKDFVLPEYRDSAYLDEALPIGFGQTISQPLTVAFMMELLAPQGGGRILDVGSGSGWTIALLGEIAGQSGKVFGVERIPELVAFGRNNLAKYKFENAEILLVGKELGLPQEAPFDRILVSAAAEELPQELINQLKVGGRMVIPIKNSIWQIDKISEQEIKREEYVGFSFVPLIQEK
ncbi:MAG TPA: protein-L-isoaspartate(D-aspartate) O-methyltransferase [Candidatus Paceibacterota bacterium]